MHLRQPIQNGYFNQLIFTVFTLVILTNQLLQITSLVRGIQPGDCLNATIGLFALPRSRLRTYSSNRKIEAKLKPVPVFSRMRRTLNQSMI